MCMLVVSIHKSTVTYLVDTVTSQFQSEAAPIDKHLEFTNKIVGSISVLSESMGVLSPVFANSIKNCNQYNMITFI